MILQVLLIKYSSEAGEIKQAIHYVEEMLESTAAVCKNKDSLLDGNSNSVLKGLLSLSNETALKYEDTRTHNIAYIMYYGYYQNGYFKALENNSTARALFEQLKVYAE